MLKKGYLDRFAYRVPTIQEMFSQQIRLVFQDLQTDKMYNIKTQIKKSIKRLPSKAIKSLA